jgi:hypothetical protein
MKTIFALLSILAFAGCATEQSLAYEKARYEANPNYADESNQSGTPYNYTPKDRNSGEYFSCLFRFNQRFSSEDSRYICQ